MTDLRDQLADFEAAARRLLDQPWRKPGMLLVLVEAAKCHPGRPLNARGLCDSCYQTHRMRGDLDRFPTSRPAGRSRADFVPDYELLRSEGYTRRQIAERLNMTFGAVTKAYLRAVRAGDLTPDRRAA